MEKGVVILFVILAMTLQLSTTAKGEADSTSVDDFSRCKKIEIEKLHIDDEVCVIIAFVKSEIGISIAITWDGKEVFKTNVSVKQPPPICFSLKLVKDLKACLKLTDVSFKPHHHGACLAIEIRVFKIHKTFKLGCIYKEIKRANRKNPLQILQAVKALVDTYDAEKTGKDEADWLKKSDESGSIQNAKHVHSFSQNMKKQVLAVGKLSQTCSCSSPSQCMCCKNVALSPSGLRTKVCGKVAGAQKEQGLWVSLMVNEAKHFRVFTPVSRRFKFACSKVEALNTIVCLQLEKVVQTVQGIDVCMSAVSTNRLTSLGCTTVNMVDEEKPNDDLVKFEPILKLVS